MAQDDLETRISLIQAMKDTEDRGRRESAWREFLGRYRPRLLAWFARLKVRPGDVADATGVALARLVQAMSRFDEEKRQGPGAFRKWLRITVGNAVIDWFRQQGHYQDVAAGGDSANEALLQVPAEELFSICEEISGRIEKDEEDLGRFEEVVRRVKKNIKEQVWQAFYLRVIEGLPAAEVAQRLQVSEAVVHTSTSRVKDYLRREAERAGISADRPAT